MSYQWITEYNSGNITAHADVARVFGMARSIEGFTYHWWGAQNSGATFEGVISWLCRPGGGSSAHIVVEDGRAACIVDFYDAAWHSGNARGNAKTIGIEMNPRASDGDYRTVAELSSQLIDAFGDQMKYPHNYWVATQCPGVYDLERIDRDSYKYISGNDWGQVTLRGSPTPPPPVTPAPEPPVVDPEWIRNLVDITDVKLTVLPAEGVQLINLVTMQPIPDQLIPKGTQVDVAKETTVGGRKFYISSWAASRGAPNGVFADLLGIPEKPPVQEKPEWLKNLQDIEDKDMWTRSATPLLNLADGTTAEILPINTKIRITHATHILEQNLMVVEGEKQCIETVYLSDKPIEDPLKDIEKRVTVLEGLIKAILDWLGSFKK